jgi:hypothetical protein
MLTLKAMHRCASATVTVPALPKLAANTKARSSGAAVDQLTATASLKRPRSAGPSNGAAGAAPRATSKGPPLVDSQLPRKETHARCQLPHSSRHRHGEDGRRDPRRHHRVRLPRPAVDLPRLRRTANGGRRRRPGHLAAAACGRHLRRRGRTEAKLEPVRDRRWLTGRSSTMIHNAPRRHPRSATG